MDEWQIPSFEEVAMNAEVGSYQEDPGTRDPEPDPIVDGAFGAPDPLVAGPAPAPSRAEEE
jgi:hypothetical protein